MYPKAVDYVSVLAPSAIHAEFEAPPKCRISLQSPAFSRFQPLKSPTRFHEAPQSLCFKYVGPVCHLRFDEHGMSEIHQGDRGPPKGAAERMRLYRERRQQGLRYV